MSTNFSRRALGKAARKRLSAAATAGRTWSSTARPWSDSVTERARPSDPDRSRTNQPRVVMRAASSARVERSMPVMRPSSAWLRPPLSVAWAAASSRTYWRWVGASGPASSA